MWFSAGGNVAWRVLQGLMCLAAALTGGTGCMSSSIVYVLMKGVPNLSLGADCQHQAQLSETTPSASCRTSSTPCTWCWPRWLSSCRWVWARPVYLTEYAANRQLVVVHIEYAAETLSGIPSIIYGLVGMLFFCQFLGMKTSLSGGA